MQIKTTDKLLNHEGKKIHAKPFPVARSHKEVFKKEVESIYMQL